MKVNQSGVIVGNIGMMMIGPAIACAVATGIGRMWQAMRLPVFLAVLLGLILGGTAVMLRDRGKRGD
jgi:hypothetical protein